MPIFCGGGCYLASSCQSLVIRDRWLSLQMDVQLILERGQHWRYYAIQDDADVRCLRIADMRVLHRQLSKWMRMLSPSHRVTRSYLGP